MSDGDAHYSHLLTADHSHVVSHLHCSFADTSTHQSAHWLLLGAASGHILYIWHYWQPVSHDFSYHVSYALSTHSPSALGVDVDLHATIREC